ncbi:hypothetical protein Tco_1343336 [Tanacetum coccineum]
MAKNINTGLDAEDEINTSRVEINTGIEDVNTDSTKVDTGRTSISTSSIIHSPKKRVYGKGKLEGWKRISMLLIRLKGTNKTRRAGLEKCYRLHAQNGEEVAKQIHLIDIEDASITKGKDEVVKEEETKVPVKKTGMTVHCLTLDASTIYMLADRKYPLSKDACQVMLKMKLLDGTMDEVCYQLLKMIEKQAGIRK